MKVYVNQFVGPTVMQGLPLAAGLLVASARADPQLRAAVDFEIVTARVAPDRAAARYVDPDIVAFSCYSWNERYSLEIARRCKARFPDALCVFGGPAVPRQPESIRDYLEAQDFVDVLVLGEGEPSFTELVSVRLADGHRHPSSLSAIAGLAVRGDGCAPPIMTAVRKRMDDFSQTGSPYLDGTFDALVQDEHFGGSVAIIETNRGCPFSCTFCDWGQATRSRVYELPEARVRQELDWIGEHEIPCLYIVDANFGIRKRDVRFIEHITEVKARTGYPTLCYFHLTKNARERNLKTVELLHHAGIQCRLALSMQDFDPRVLEAIKRANIKPERALALRQRCHDKGIATFNELILGLPEQTYEGFRDSIVEAMTPFAADRFSLYLCQLIANSEMASPEHRARFGLQTVRSVMGSTDPTYTAHVDEFEELVIATSTMPAAAWCRAYRFGYLASAFYNSNVLRTTLRNLQFVHEANVAAWFETVLETMAQARPETAFGAAWEVFERHIRAVRTGGPLYLPSEAMGVRGCSIEEALILTIQSRLEEFFGQIHETTRDFLQRTQPEFPDHLLSDWLEAERS